jgi:hypothetical protein
VESPIVFSGRCKQIVKVNLAQKLMVERIESLKAGVIGGLSVGFAFFSMTLVNAWMITKYFPILGLEKLNILDFDFWLSGAVAGFSGFLFGVTYRYIVRWDENPHLKTGAVFAFGLVRGLTQIECGWQSAAGLWPSLVLAGESLLWFASAGLILDVAMKKEIVGRI